MQEKIVLSPEELRQLQLTELEMIVEVDRICRKYQIQYSLDGGTLLGCIRHQGFIPWDDDADVIFTRHEYAKFFKACKKELDTERFFLQDYRTDKNYRWGYAKLRRKNTEFVRKGQENMHYRTGVCIDVFVVDNVPDSPLLRRIYYGINFFIRKVMYSEWGQTAEDSAAMRALYRLLYKIPKDSMFRLRNVLASAANRKKTKLKSHLLFPYPSKACKYGMPAECFEEVEEREFEGMRFPVFKQYDEYLTLLYGDYMALPPVEKRGSHASTKIELLPITLEEIQKRYREENQREEIKA